MAFFYFPLFMIKSIKTDQIKLHDIFFSHLVCLHALISISQNESNLISDSENSVYMNHKCCNRIYIFIYMCISCRPIIVHVQKGIFYSDWAYSWIQAFTSLIFPVSRIISCQLFHSDQAQSDQLRCLHELFSVQLCH